MSYTTNSIILYCTETHLTTERYTAADCTGTATIESVQFGECLDKGNGYWQMYTNGVDPNATEEAANHVKTTFFVALAALAGAYI